MLFLICGGTLLRVEKVKPDPLNLSVKTGVGKRFTHICLCLKGLSFTVSPFFML